MKHLINKFIAKFKRPFYEWSEWQTIIIGAILGLILVFLTQPIRSCNNSNKISRNYAYEHYVDSVYNVNPDYYLDVICETDEYQEYVNKHGEWWNN